MAKTGRSFRTVLMATLVLVGFASSPQPAQAQIFEQKPPTKPTPKQPTQQKRKKSAQKAKSISILVPAPLPPFVGAVPRVMTGDWGFVTTSGLLESNFVVAIRVDGGEIGTPIGRVDFWMQTTDGLRRACGATLFLTGYDGSILTSEVKLENKDIFCPGGKKMTARIGNEGLWVEFLKPSKKGDRTTMQSWAQRRTSRR